jgi:hypothetical protein
MPLSAIGEFFLQPLFEIIFQVLGYLTGRIVVPVFSFGLVRVERIVEKIKHRPSLKNVRVESDRSRVISADAGTFLGILFWCLVGFTVFLFKSSS